MSGSTLALGRNPLYQAFRARSCSSIRANISTRPLVLRSFTISPYPKPALNPIRTFSLGYKLPVISHSVRLVSTDSTHRRPSSTSSTANNANRSAPLLALAPSPPIRDIETPDPSKGTITKAVLYAWYYCRFLFYGVTLSWQERKLVNEVRRRVNHGGLPYDWRESLMEVRVRSDWRKMIPFVVIAAVIEEIVPLLILLAPTLIPSTVLLPTQSFSVRQKQETRRHDARSVLYARLQEVKADKSDKNALDLGWNGNNWVNWEDEDMKKLLRAYDLGTRSPSRSYLESRVYNHVSFLESDDKLLIGRPPTAGLTLSEFQKALGDRGLLCLDLPASSLPGVLDRYLEARRSNPRFHPFVYLVNDIDRHQPAQDAAREKKRMREKDEREREMSENGGYYGWRAKVRRWALKTVGGNK
ncbi:LETM1-like [Phaffia rhodozyma]|uniref:LETM1-like n=1 Tax=Phaffia rhodozyma TaxID=264483 RepID=A0A0F7SMT4_PHARH|nr:LETM1-like [Phaffia rhodozyma]